MLDLNPVQLYEWQLTQGNIMVENVALTEWQMALGGFVAVLTENLLRGVQNKNVAAAAVLLSATFSIESD